jgi:hypothetical protein
LRAARLLRRQHRGQGIDVELDLARGAARLHDGVGHHHPHHLADVLHRVLANTGSSWPKAASMGSPGMSRASTTPRTPGMASAMRGVHPAQPAMRHGASMMGAACSVPLTSGMSSM